MKRRIWPILLASGLGLMLLLSLGVWQVQRLAWKQGLIAAIDREFAAEATSFEPGQIYSEYRKLKVKGMFSGAPLQMIGIFQGGPGWRLVQRFDTEGGQQLLLDRGTASDGMTINTPSSLVDVTGLVRLHNQGKGYFDPLNDVSGNHWFWWDLPAMQQALGVEPAQGAGFVLQLLPGMPGSDGLDVPPPKADLRNNHLGYAITWFGLALVLAVMTGVLVVQIRRERRSH